MAVIGANFWSGFTPLLLIGLALFPRLTLFLFFTSSGVLWWLVWIFFPRILFAYEIYSLYGHTNPVLSTLVWAWVIWRQFFWKQSRIKLINPRSIMVKDFDRSDFRNDDVIDVEGKVKEDD